MRPRQEWVESLERRMLLTAAVEAALGSAEDLSAAGFEQIVWKGETRWVKPDEWVVKVGGNRSVEKVGKRLGNVNSHLSVNRTLEFSRQFVLQSTSGWSYGKVKNAVDDVEGFKYVEPNFAVWADSTTPNDPSYSSLWGLNNTGQTGGTSDDDIDAPEAWDVTTGSSNIVIGVIDTGIDYNHPDLAANIWTNTGEIAGNGIDDDGNGFVDDIHGYDFIGAGDSNPMDDFYHGTHVAGTIAGVGNNGVGVTGVAWNAKLMALKFLDNTGHGDTADAAEALNYAVMMKNRGVNIKLTNNSWGGGGYSQAMFDAIKASGDAGMLFVAAAGNDGVNTDSSISYPAGYNLPNVVSVAATNSSDVLASFSNFGKTSVDLAAPGVGIYSTSPGNSYRYLDGTSMATPHVSGVAALAWSVNPTATYQQVKDALLNGGDARASLAGKTVTGKRLNAVGTLNLMQLRVVSSTPAAGSVVSTPPTDFIVTFSDPVNPATVTAADLVVNGVSVDQVTEVTAPIDNTMFRFRFTTSPVTGEGVQTMSMPAGVITRSGDARLNAAWSAQFRYDATPLTVISASPTPGATVPLPMTSLQLKFSEPVDPLSFSTSDLQLSSGTISNYVINSDTVTYTLSGLTTDTALSVSMALGAVNDTSGNSLSAAFSTVYNLDRTTDTVLTLNSVNSDLRVFKSAPITGGIGGPNDADRFLVNVQAGQTLSVALDNVASPSFRGIITLLDPSGTFVASATASSAGMAALLQGAALNTTGVYTVTISAASGTTGNYSLTAALNAIEERESHGLGDNDPEGATPENINSFFTPVPGTGGVVKQLAILGSSDSAQTADYYALSLTQGQSLSARLLNTTTAGNLGIEWQQQDVLAYRDAGSGTVWSIENFVAPWTATYYIKVYDESTYTLALTIGGALAQTSSMTLATAQPLGGRVGASGFLQTSANRPAAYYAVPVAAGNVLNIATSTFTAGSTPALLDPALTLYNASGTVLASDDNSAADGRNAKITYTAASAGTVYVAVTPVGSTSGMYSLSVTGASGAAPAFNVIATDPSENAFADPQNLFNISFTFNDGIRLDTVDTNDLLIDGVASIGAHFSSDAGNTIGFAVPSSALSNGTHTYTLPAGALRDTQGTLSQAYTGHYVIDKVGPRVLSSSITQGQTTMNPLSVVIAFNEPMNVANLDPFDFSLTGAVSGSVAGTGSYSADGKTLTLTYGNVPFDSFTLTLKSGNGRFEDAQGNDLDGEATWPLPAQGSGNGTPGGNFVVNFSVSAPTTDEVILDNDSAAGVTRSSGWTVSTSDTGYLGSNYLHDGNAGRGSKWVTYAPQLASGGQYQVWARWTSSNNRATNARYEIVKGPGQTAQIVTKNQKTNGGAWVLLGTYDLSPGANVTIRNTGADGYVVADGVRFLRVGALPPPVLPAAPTLQSVTPTSTTSMQLKWADNSDNEESFFVFYSSSPDMTGANQVGGVPANATTSTATGLTPGATYYFRIGAFNSAGWTYSNIVQATMTYTPPTQADIILDNDSAGVTKSTGWTSSTSDKGYLGSNYLHDGNTGRGTKWVTYKPTLPTTGQYQVWARWTSSSNRASNARYEIVKGAGQTAVVVTKSQKTNGGVWVLLGTYDLASGAAVTIRNTGADGYVVADGIKFVKM